MDSTKDNRYWKNFILGIGFTFVFAFIGYLLVFVPGLNHVGPLASAIILAIVYRQLFGYPTLFRSGIQFSSKYLLRFAIILYGLKLNIDVIFSEGLGLLVKGSITIIFVLLVIMFLAKILHANTQITLLLGIGTGVCGAAAIAAVAPIVKAKEDETAISVGIIALVGTVFSIMYALLLPLLPISDVQYGIWSGLSLHELAHVALAAEPAGEEALAFSLLAKLGRVFLLVPLCFILILWMKSRKATNKEVNTKVTFPWFLLGFIAMSIFGSYVIGDILPVTERVMSGVSIATTFILTSAMVGLGLNVSMKDVKNKAFRPLIAMLIASVFVSLLMYWVAGI